MLRLDGSEMQDLTSGGTGEGGGGRLRSPSGCRGGRDTCSKGRASTKRQTMPVGTLYTFLDQAAGWLENGSPEFRGAP